MQDAKAEFLQVWDIIHEFYPAFGFDLTVRLSTHDPEHPENYLGDIALWKQSEDMLKEIVREKGIEAIAGVGEAAFYGPKLDFMAQDSIGRTWQVATIQLDMNQPERFDLFCINEKGEKERIVMIHAAIMGSIERFLSVLIEHTGGNLPTWLAPVQARVLPISSEKHGAYASEVLRTLKEAGIRADIDEANESLGKKIRGAKGEKIPYVLIVGDAEAEAGTVSVESRDEGKLDPMSTEELLTRLKEEIGARK
jgi:threonyl-tRNA synthetase